MESNECTDNIPSAVENKYAKLPQINKVEILEVNVMIPIQFIQVKIIIGT